MRCEVCGRKILGEPYRVVIEGAKLAVCNDCSKHGKLTWEEEPKPRVVAKASGSKILVKTRAPSLPQAPSDTTVELVEGFDLKIRQAREKTGLSHEELGKKINEKVSLLRKIETGKMTPNNMLAAKLERTLKIKIIVPTSDEKIKVPPSKMAKPINRELTLGDLIQINKKKSINQGDSAERKQS